MSGLNWVRIKASRFYSKVRLILFSTKRPIGAPNWSSQILYFNSCFLTRAKYSCMLHVIVVVTVCGLYVQCSYYIHHTNYMYSILLMIVESVFHQLVWYWGWKLYLRSSGQQNSASSFVSSDDNQMIIFLAI